MMSIIARTIVAAVAIVAAWFGVVAPASAAVDLSVKRAIVSVVLDNLGVQASDALIAEIASTIDPAEISAGLYSSVAALLDSGSDPRAAIEGVTDANGDGVPEVGAAVKSPNANANSNATEKSDNSDDKSSNSTSRNSNGTSSSSNSGGSSSSSGGSGSSSGNSGGDSSEDDGSSEESNDNEDDD